MLNKIEKRFKKPRVLLPVVHCCDETQARKAVDVAMNAGADGVFLIDQGGMREAGVQRLASELEETIFVGMNLLSFGRRAFELLPEFSSVSIWADNAGFDSSWSQKLLDHYRNILVRDQEALAWRGLFFGGVAFKYQHAVASDDWGRVAAMAAELDIDVITTSGDATGQPPSVEKVQAMRGAIGEHALAVASGITPDNVGEFLPYVNAFLVATGIESSLGVFDAGRVKALADAVHGFVGATS